MSFTKQVQQFLEPVLPDAELPALPEFLLDCSNLDLMTLALEDALSFVKLEFFYPVFLASKVTCFEELSLYCLVLEMKWERLLRSPAVQEFLQDGSLVVGLVNQIPIFRSKRFDFAVQYIKTLDELVLICKANPFYLQLVGNRKSVKRSDAFIYSLGPLAHLVRNQADLMRLCFGDSLFMDCVYNIPELRNLIVDRQAWKFQICQYQHPLVQKKYPPKPNKSLAYGLFYEHLKPIRADFPIKLDPAWMMTMGEFMEFTQFDPQCGYYSAGSIKFTKGDLRGHYQTEASAHKTLAVALATRAFEMWLPVLDMPYFEVLEIGAGDGDLCDQLLRFIDAKAPQSKIWKRFANNIHYTIIEKAPALIRRQSQLLQSRINAGQVTILAGDALSAFPAEYKREVHLHLSNELVDMFPSEEIYMDDDAELFVCIALPTLTEDGLDYLEVNHPDLAQKILASTDHLRLYLQDLMIAVPANQTVPLDDRILVAADECKDLLRLVKSSEYAGPKAPLLFFKRAVPLGCRPDLLEAFHTQESLTTLMHPNTTRIFCPQITNYAWIVSQAAISIVIDYGVTGDRLLNSSYRTFGDSTCYREYPFANPCKSDVTYDINFTELAEAIMRLSPKSRFYFGLMGGLYPSDLDLPRSYRKAIDPHELQRFKSEEYGLLVCYQPNVNYLTNLEPSKGKAIREYHLFAKNRYLAARLPETSNIPKFL